MIYRNPIDGKLNPIYLLKKSRKTISVVILAMLINVSPYLSKIGAAEEFWIRVVKELFIEAGKEGIRRYNKRELPVNQSEPFDSEISKYLAARRVNFSNKTDGRNYSGRVIRSWMQRNSDTSQSGAAVAISWKDDVVTKIIFLENQRVRIWSGGKEYLGQWIAKDGILYVKTDVGSLYRFY
jgi:hypothetical protein